VLGPFRVGDRAKIASGAVVLAEIPDDATAVGVPARIVRIGGQKASDLDHIHIPDPVSQLICGLQGEVTLLSQRIKALEESRQP
jgi:serine O-acetyltransferase